MRDLSPIRGERLINTEEESSFSSENNELAIYDAVLEANKRNQNCEREEEKLQTVVA